MYHGLLYRVCTRFMEYAGGSMISQTPTADVHLALDGMRVSYLYSITCASSCIPLGIAKHSSDSTEMMEDLIHPTSACYSHCMCARTDHPILRLTSLIPPAHTRHLARTAAVLTRFETARSDALPNPEADDERCRCSDQEHQRHGDIICFVDNKPPRERLD